MHTYTQSPFFLQVWKVIKMTLQAETIQNILNNKGKIIIFPWLQIICKTFKIIPLKSGKTNIYLVHCDFKIWNYWELKGLNFFVEKSPRILWAMVTTFLLYNLQFGTKVFLWHGELAYSFLSLNQLLAFYSLYFLCHEIQNSFSEMFFGQCHFF